MHCKLWSYFLTCIVVCSSALADHPIPADSRQNWDFRGPPRTITRKSYEKLFSCKTYEELRDALIIAIEDLEHEPDDPTPLYVASSCRLALIRTYYILGDYKTADRLLAQYSSVHRDANGNLNVSGESLRSDSGQKQEAEQDEDADAE